MYIWEPQHNKQNHDFTRHCATPPTTTTTTKAAQHVSKPHLPLTVAFSCILCITGGIMKQISHLMASLLLYAPVTCFNQRKKTEAFHVCICTIMLSWHWIKRIKEENSRNKAELKDRKARCIKPVWLKIMAFSEKHESEMKEEERVESEGLSSFCYIIEQNTERVESVSAWCPIVFLLGQELRVRSGINAHGERKKGLMFGSSIQSILSTLAFLFRWSLTPRGSVHHWSQRKKKSLPRVIVSLLLFYSVSSVAAI